MNTESSYGVDAKAILIDRETRFLQFLSAVAQSEVKTQRILKKSIQYILSTDIPTTSYITIGGSTTSSQQSNAWLTIKQVSKPTPPTLPKHIEPYIEKRSIASVTSKPKFNAHFRALVDQIRENPLDYDLKQEIQHIKEEFLSWQESTWQTWVQVSEKQEASYNLYRKLFDLYLRLNRESDYLEALFGHCILTYKGNIEVSYPLITTRVEFLFNETTGAISIRPAAMPVLNLDVLDGITLFQNPSLKRLQDDFNANPINLWDSAELQYLYKTLATSLGPETEIDNILSLDITDTPKLHHGWSLLIRTRTDNRGVFYNRLATKLRDESYIPAAFNTIFNDPSTVSAVLGNANLSNQHNIDAPLLALPSNKEQEQIINQLDAHSGITVQGPPGTGKSHTIVNIISHLLAQGKRVLVTAEKEQALAVLSDKIPTSLRDLAVTSIGNTTSDIERLRLSTQRMQDAIFSLDGKEASARLAELKDKIQDYSQHLNRINSDLYTAIAHCNDRCQTSQHNYSMQEVINNIEAAQDRISIADTIEPRTAAPLTDAEFKEYVALCQSLENQDDSVIEYVLPSQLDLPDEQELESAFDKYVSLSATITSNELKHIKTQAIQQADVQDLQHDIDAALSLINQLPQGLSDEAQNFSLYIRANSSSISTIANNLSKIIESCETCMQLDQALIGHIISVPQGNPREQINIIQSWKNLIELGKNIPKFTFSKSMKEIKAFSQQTTLDSYVPNTIDGLDLITKYIQRNDAFQHLTIALQQTAQVLPIRQFDSISQPVIEIHQYALQLQQLCTWWGTSYIELQKIMDNYIVRTEEADNAPNPAPIWRQNLNLVSSYKTLAQINHQLEIAKTIINTQRTQTSGLMHEIWSELHSAISNKNITQWYTALSKVQRITQIQKDIHHCDTLFNKLATAAPEWANYVRANPTSTAVSTVAEHFEATWELHEQYYWIRDIIRSSKTHNLITRYSSLQHQKQEAVTSYIELSAKLHLKQSQNPDERKALHTWLDATKKYGKGTGKNASRYLATARIQLPKAMNAMPVWIMPIHAVMENFDPTISQPFDVIIVDESSQCDLLSTGILALARQAIIVGDDKQTSPTGAFRNLTTINKLQEQHIPDFEDKALFTFDESLYSLANRAFQSQILLKEHFRCVPEIIDFCNRFYDGQIFPLRERSFPQIGAPIHDVFVSEGKSVKSGADTINPVEADTVVKIIKSCCSNPAYDGMSFGVVTMMSGRQRDIIEDKLISELGPEEYSKRKLRVGNPPAFQGDERNVILLSFVTDAASQHAYVASRQSDAQWVNVAASRAKDQLWVVHSFAAETLSTRDYRRELIEYASALSGKADTRSRHTDNSSFENDVISYLINHEYTNITSHYRVGRYSIDLVVTITDGFRLAILCDGDKDELSTREIQQEIEQQRVLERLGWNIFRLNIAEFYLDRANAMQPILDALSELTRKQQILDSIAVQSNQIATPTNFPKSNGDAEAGTIDHQTNTEAANAKLASTSLTSADSAPASSASVTSTPLELAPNDLAKSVNQPLTSKNPDSHGQKGNNYRLLKLALLNVTVRPAEYGLSTNRLIPIQSIPFSDPWLGVKKWAKNSTIFLVANEFPLKKDFLVQQLNERLKSKRIYSHSFKEHIAAALKEVIEEHCIFIYDEYLYPNFADIPFSITLGRAVECVSQSELCAVICTVLSARDFWVIDTLETALSDVYHIRDYDQDKFHSLYMSALKRLINSDDIFMIKDTVTIDRTKVNVLTPPSNYFKERLRKFE